MTLNFELPKPADYNISKIKELAEQKSKVEKYAEIAVGVVAAVVIAKIAIGIIDGAKETKQNRRIKKLEQRVDELEKKNREAE